MRLVLLIVALFACALGALDSLRGYDWNQSFLLFSALGLFVAAFLPWNTR